MRTFWQMAIQIVFVYSLRLEKVNVKRDVTPMRGTIYSQ
jgi:hypothetical protein